MVIVVEVGALAVVCLVSICSRRSGEEGRAAPNAASSETAAKYKKWKRTNERKINERRMKESGGESNPNRK